MTIANRPDAIVVIDFGSQYTHLIARRIRELQVYSEIIPATADAHAISHLNACGVILSGGPASVYDRGAPAIRQWVVDSGLPVLGICYGMQAMVHLLGGTVAPGDVREYRARRFDQRRSRFGTPGRGRQQRPGLDEPRRPCRSAAQWHDRAGPHLQHHVRRRNRRQAMVRAPVPSRGAAHPRTA